MTIVYIRSANVKLKPGVRLTLYTAYVCTCVRSAAHAYFQAHRPIYLFCAHRVYVQSKIRLAKCVALVWDVSRRETDRNVLIWSALGSIYSVLSGEEEETSPTRAVTVTGSGCVFVDRYVYRDASWRTRGKVNK